MVENKDIELVDKLKKRGKQFAHLLNVLSPQDIDELRKDDKSFDDDIRVISNIIGSSNPYWRVHPMYPNIRCSINGEIDISGHTFQLREFGGMLKVCYSGSRKKLSAPDLIMACFNPCPSDDRSQWRICYKDHNFKNIKPSNLYWERVFVR